MKISTIIFLISTLILISSCQKTADRITPQEEQDMTRSASGNPTPDTPASP